MSKWLARGVAVNRGGCGVGGGISGGGVIVAVSTVRADVNIGTLVTVQAVGGAVGRNGVRAGGAIVTALTVGEGSGVADGCTGLDVAVSRCPIVTVDVGDGEGKAVCVGTMTWDTSVGSGT